jgi:hypothetical protein
MGQGEAFYVAGWAVGVAEAIQPQFQCILWYTAPGLPWCLGCPVSGFQFRLAYVLLPMNAARCLRLLVLLASSTFTLIHAYAIHSSCATYGTGVKEAMEEVQSMATLAVRKLGPPPFLDTEDNSSEQLWSGFSAADFNDLKGTAPKAFDDD